MLLITTLALEDARKKKIVHRDISIRNLMFKKNTDPKAIREGMLIDFDYCLKIGAKTAIARSERTVGDSLNCRSVPNHIVREPILSSP